jgi:hypothetical protein
MPEPGYRHGPAHHHAPGQQRSFDPLNSTSLKWRQDGELSELDHARILALLTQVDPVAEALIHVRSEVLG